METLTLKGTRDQWVVLFASNSVIAVTDGSFQRSMGTLAFIMTTLDPDCPTQAIGAIMCLAQTTLKPHIVAK